MSPCFSSPPGTKAASHGRYPKGPEQRSAEERHATEGPEQHIAEDTHVAYVIS